MVSQIAEQPQAGLFQFFAQCRFHGLSEPDHEMMTVARGMIVQQSDCFRTGPERSRYRRTAPADSVSLCDGFRPYGSNIEQAGDHQQIAEPSLA